MKTFLKYTIVLLLFFIVSACGGGADNMKTGSDAPDFTLEDAHGTKYTLSDYEGKSPVVVYFYPKAGTPGCTDQACGLRDDMSKFKENNVAVLGISTDSKEDLIDFEKEYNLNFPLLSDESQEVSKKFDVLNNLGFSSRITFIVDKEGKIKHIMRDVDVETHADEVLKLAMK